jgi:hypothetical protein
MATVGDVLVAALIVAGVFIWEGSTLLLDVWWKRQPTYLVGRLMPYQWGSVADEARHSLDQQS